MATPGYSLAISAVDNVSGLLAKINAKLEASQTAATKRVSAAVAPWQRFGAQIQKTGQLLGFDKAQAGLAKLGKGFQTIGHYSMDAFRNIARIVQPLGIITGALSLAGMYKLISAWSDFGTQLGFASTRIGMGVSQLQGLQGAAQLAGVSAGALTGGLQDLGQTLYDAAGGRNQQAVALMNQLGISWQKGVGQAKSVADVLPQVADAIAKLKDPYAQAQAAAILFGGAAEEMLPFLRLGSKGIAEYNAAALKYGVMNRKGVEAANDFRMAQTKVELAVRGLTNSIAEKLSPILVPLLTQMADWIASNRAWIATDIGKYVGEFVTWIKSIDWKQVGSDIDGYYTKLTRVANALGGWESTAKDVLLVIGGVWIAGMLAPLVLLSAAVLKVAAGFLAIGANATKGGGIAATAMRTLMLAMIADKIVDAADPKDKAGTWIDQHSTAAAALDDYMARTFGVGRTYAEQDAAAGNPPGTAAGGNVTQSYSGGQPSPGPLQTSVFRNNNPTNLMAYPGQNYATGANGRWATYKTVADGLAGGLHQMLIDQDRGYNSVAKEITRRSPPSENDTAGMIKTIAGQMKIDPNAVYNLRDRAQAAAFLRADVLRETGHEPTDADVQTALSEEIGPIKPPRAKAPDGQLTATAKMLGFAGGPGRSPSGPAPARLAAVHHGASAPVAADAETKRLIAAGEADYNASMEIAKAALAGVPPVALPSTSTSAQAGKVDVAVKISHDGSIKSATKTTGVGVGKLRVDTPMQAHAA